MADLNPEGWRGDGSDAARPTAVSGQADRGQLIVVGALVLGTLLLALVLLVNTTIYAENLATRNPDVGDEEALAYRAAVIDGVGEIADRETGAEYDDYGNLTENVSRGIAALDRHLGRHQVRRGVDASINRSTVTYDAGRLVRQNESENVTDTAGRANWTVVWNTNGTRRFAATVNRSSLTETTASSIEADGAAADGAFYVSVAENATPVEEWRAYVYNDSSTGNLSVAVKPGNTVTRVCSADASSATVDFTDGTLAGEPCPGLRWGENTSGRYDLAVTNGNNATGRYNLTVRTEDGGLLHESALVDGATATAPESPYFVPAVYSADLELRYRSSELEYVTRIRVAPGESDD
jgi:hypothetical protein